MENEAEFASAGSQEEMAFRYSAFFSYRSKDRALASSLIHKLETYRTPKELVGRRTRSGKIGRRIGSICQDRQTFPTQSHLDTVIREKLSQSKSLIVLCTPTAAEPESWVGREIELFRQLRPDCEIHAIIGYGDPPDCFPAPLLVREADGRLRQPLAADMRKVGDGPERALIKLIAGILGLEDFDDLWNRERRRKRIHALRNAAIASVVAMALVAAGVTSFVQADLQRSNEIADKSLQLAAQRPELASLLAIAASPALDGGLLPMTDAASAALSLANANQHRPTYIQPGARSFTDAAFSPTGDQLVTLTEDGQVEIFSTRDGARIRAWTHMGASSVAFDGKRALVAASRKDKRISVFEVGSDEPVYTVKGPCFLISSSFEQCDGYPARFSRDGKYLFAGGEGGPWAPFLVWKATGDPVPVDAKLLEQLGLPLIDNSQMRFPNWPNAFPDQLRPLRAETDEDQLACNTNELALQSRDRDGFLVCVYHDGSVTVPFNDPSLPSAQIQTADYDPASGLLAALSGDGRVFVLNPSASWPQTEEVVLEPHLNDKTQPIIRLDAQLRQIFVDPGDGAARLIPVAAADSDLVGEEGLGPDQKFSSPDGQLTGYNQSEHVVIDSSGRNLARLSRTECRGEAKPPCLLSLVGIPDATRALLVDVVNLRVFGWSKDALAPYESSEGLASLHVNFSDKISVRPDGGVEEAGWTAAIDVRGVSPKDLERIRSEYPPPEGCIPYEGTSLDTCEIYGAIWTSDRKILVVSYDQYLGIWDVPTRRLISIVRGVATERLRLTQDDRVLLTTGMGAVPADISLTFNAIVLPLRGKEARAALCEEGRLARREFTDEEMREFAELLQGSDRAPCGRAGLGSLNYYARLFN
jgi:hypothetical protein